MLAGDDGDDDDDATGVVVVLCRDGVEPDAEEGLILDNDSCRARIQYG